MIINYKSNIYYIHIFDDDRLYELVVRVPSYRSRGPGFDFRHYRRRRSHVTTDSKYLLRGSSIKCNVAVHCCGEKCHLALASMFCSHKQEFFQ
jgi:hypothetical protein